MPPESRSPPWIHRDLAYNALKPMTAETQLKTPQGLDSPGDWRQLDSPQFDEADFQKVDLHHELDNALELVSRETRGETRVEKSYEELPELHVHVREIGQAVMTIMCNAFEATQGEGTLTLTTRHDVEANQVVLSIEDDGPGIPGDRLETLFDVGLRQKEGRMAVGFGLPGAHSVVLRHGGQFAVESRLGVGTTFTIRLPVR